MLAYRRTRRILPPYAALSLHPKSAILRSEACRCVWQGEIIRYDHEKKEKDNA